MTKAEFVDQIDQATNEALAKGVQFNKAVASAQAALESNWGNSELAQKANNLFSIKVGNSWRGEAVHSSGIEWHHSYGWYQTAVAWRKYSDWVECIMDYAKIISEYWWYKDAVGFINNATLYLKSILPNGSEPGWATDPDYYHKIVIIAAEIEALGGPKWNETK